MIPSLTLPPNCSHYVTITSGDGHSTLFQSCKTRMSPVMFPVKQTGIRIEFSGSGSSTAPGFLMSVVTVSRDLEYIITGARDQADSDTSMVARLVQTMMDYSKQVGCFDQERVNIIRTNVTQDQERMVKIFSMMTPAQEKKRKTKPLLEVTRVKPKKKFVVVEKRKGN